MLHYIFIWMLFYQKDKRAKPEFLSQSNVLSETGKRWIEMYLPFTLTRLLPYQVKQMPTYQSKHEHSPLPQAGYKHQHTSRMSCYRTKQERNCLYMM
jgi:hypothetical protein